MFLNLPVRRQLLGGAVTVPVQSDSDPDLVFVLDGSKAVQPPL